MMLLNTRIVTLACSTLLIASIGCVTHEIDYRRIHEPIMLNADPVVGGSPPKARVFKEMYVAKAHEMVAAASGGQTAGSQDYSESNKQNNLNVNAFYDVVGYKNRAITEITLDAHGWGLNMLVALISTFTVDVTGKLVEIDRSALAGQSDQQGAER